MLATKSISLGELQQNVSHLPSIIKGEDREIIASYEEYILNKTLEADSIIEQAQHLAMTIAQEAKEQAEIEFWQQANAFYSDLEALKADIIDSVEQQCRNVVVACLRELVDIIPSEDKIKPMIAALLAENINDDPARLYIHPEQIDQLDAYLSTLAVPIEADASLEQDCIVLKSEKSQYQASFTGRLQLLIRALESR